MILLTIIPAKGIGILIAGAILFGVWWIKPDDNREDAGK